MSLYMPPPVAEVVSLAVPEAVSLASEPDHHLFIAEVMSLAVAVAEVQDCAGELPMARLAA